MFRGAFPDNSESLLAVSRVACGSGTGDHQTGAVRLRWGEMEGCGGGFFPRVGGPTTPFSCLLFLHAVYSGGEKQELEKKWPEYEGFTKGVNTRCTETKTPSQPAPRPEILINAFGYLKAMSSLLSPHRLMQPLLRNFVSSSNKNG